MPQTLGKIGTWYDPETNMGYSGPQKKSTDIPADPRTGKPLEVPETSGGSLEGTLGKTTTPEEATTPKPKEKELPSAPSDNLSVFEELLKKVSDKYGRASTMTGLGSATGVLGVKPEAISGRNLSGIIDFVKGQSEAGISDIYTSTIDLLEETGTKADSQISRLISEGALSQFNDEQIAKLAASSPTYDYEGLLGIKAVQEAPRSFQTIQEGGKTVRVGFDAMGNVVSKTDIGGVDADNTVQNKVDADSLQLQIEKEEDPLKYYEDIMRDPDVPSEVKQYLERPEILSDYKKKYNEIWKKVENDPDKYDVKYNSEGEMTEIWEIVGGLGRNKKLWPIY